VESWSGTPFDMPDELELYLLTNGPEMPMLHAAQVAVDQEVVNRTVRNGTPALVRGRSFAYRVKRENAETVSGYETGVIAHGPEAEQVGKELLAMIQTWAASYYRRNAASIAYYPKTGDAVSPAGWHRSKRHGVLSVAWS
jgi:protein-L-isoaspartate(D-aspartate) O-methyltransferase